MTVYYRLWNEQQNSSVLSITWQSHSNPTRTFGLNRTWRHPSLNVQICRRFEWDAAIVLGRSEAADISTQVIGGQVGTKPVPDLPMTMISSGRLGRWIWTPLMDSSFTLSQMIDAPLQSAPIDPLSLLLLMTQRKIPFAFIYFDFISIYLMRFLPPVGRPKMEVLSTVPRWPVNRTGCVFLFHWQINRSETVMPAPPSALAQHLKCTL